MIFQLDIIPSVKGYGGTSAESTIVLADEKLREAIRNESPVMFERMMSRRKYIENELHITMNEDVMPMASTLGYLRPLLLNKEKAMACD